MNLVDPKVDAYAEAHTTPSGELFERLAAETREKTDVPQMMVGEVEGRFLEFLVRLTGAKRVLELGTFTGYSSLSMARGLPEGGRVITCDVNEETTAIARRYAEEAGLIDRIEYRLGPGVEHDRAARRAVRSRLHRRGQAGLHRLLRGGAAEARRRRPDRRGQRAARRARARRGCRTSR